MFINKQFEIEKFRRRFSVLFLVTSCLVLSQSEKFH